MGRYDILLGRQLRPAPRIKLVPHKKSSKKEPADLSTLADTDAGESLIRRCLRSAAGRVQLAQSMTNPIRRRLDYNSFARRIFRVEPLPPRVVPVYNMDESTLAFYVGEDGTTIEHRSDNRFIIPLFEVASNPSILLTQLREERRHSLLLHRAQDSAINQIRAAEEERSLSLLDAVVTEYTDQNIHISELDSNSLSSAFTTIEHNDLVVRNILMNARDYSRLRPQLAARGCLDVNRDRTMLLYGILANLWGAQIIVSELVPAGRVYLTADPEFTGVLPIRTEITVLSADSPPNIGWSIFEQIGLGVPNPRGVAALTTENYEEPIKDKPNVPEIPIIHKTRYQILRGT